MAGSLVNLPERWATLYLPFEKPPLNANQRLHWAKKAQLTREIRDATRLLAVSAKLPKGATHLDVEMVVTPKTRARRDADNLVPTLKAACDGLVDYGIVPDDTPQWMTKHMPVIADAKPNDPGVALELRWRL